jgi:hypothetical protein
MASPTSRVIQRILAAAIGGYALAAAVSACLSYALPMPRADATLTGILVSFLIYVGVVMWVFAARSLKRLWWQLGGATVVFGALALLLSPQLVLS